MDTSRGAVFFSKHFFPNSKDTYCDANRIRKMQTVKSRSDPHSRKLFLGTLIVYNAWDLIEFLKSICPILILLFIRKVDPQHPRFLSSIAFSLFDRIFLKLERYIWWRQKLHFASSSPIGVWPYRNWDFSLIVFFRNLKDAYGGANKHTLRQAAQSGCALIEIGICFQTLFCKYSDWCIVTPSKDLFGSSLIGSAMRTEPISRQEWHFPLFDRAFFDFERYLLWR